MEYVLLVCRQDTQTLIELLESAEQAKLDLVGTSEGSIMLNIGGFISVPESRSWGLSYGKALKGSSLHQNH